MNLSLKLQWVNAKTLIGPSNSCLDNYYIYFSTLDIYNTGIFLVKEKDMAKAKKGGKAAKGKAAPARKASSKAKGKSSNA